MPTGPRSVVLAGIVAAAAAACARTEAGPAPTARAMTSTWHYDVTVAPDLGRLDVVLRIDGPSPRGLMLGDESGLGALGSVTAADDASPALAAPDGVYATAALGEDAEIRYSVDLASLASGGGRRSVSRRVADDVRTSAGQWLLRPTPRAGDAAATLRFRLPEGVHVSAPWTPDGAAWRLPPSTWEWRGLVAFTRRAPAEIDVGGRTVSMALLDGSRGITPAGAERAIGDAARAVASLYGGFPVPRAQLLLEPVPGTSACPFGMTLRGGGPAVHLYVGADGRDDALHRDWTPVHEITHLGMPWLRDEDAWLSEGWVTYYTEILRARGGLVPRGDLWQNLVDGFRRGLRGRTGRTLADDSREMGVRHAYQRVYWGGAAVALELDVELRRSSGGKRSLDDAVRELHRLKSADPRVWTADECVTALDRWLGRPLFSEVSARRLAAQGIPGLDTLWEDLGVVVRSDVEDDPVSLDDAAPLAAIRKAIPAGRD